MARLSTTRQPELLPLPPAAFLGLRLFLRSDGMPSVDHDSTSHPVITPVELDTLGHWLRIGEPTLVARWRLGRRSS